MVLETEPRALCMLSKCSTTELHCHLSVDLYSDSLSSVTSTTLSPHLTACPHWSHNSGLSELNIETEVFTVTIVYDGKRIPAFPLATHSPPDLLSRPQRTICKNSSPSFSSFYLSNPAIFWHLLQINTQTHIREVLLYEGRC